VFADSKINARDCLNGPGLHACDEVAMVRGELPDALVFDEIPVSTPLVTLVPLRT
jgi:hypothetical protein